jgi:uncharacterized protein YjbI with pentapeptide repeats
MVSPPEDWIKHGMRRGELRGGQFPNLNLQGVVLDGENLSNVNFTCTNLEDGQLKGADLRNTNLAGANLAGADLRGSDLRYANLNGANLTGANLSGSNLNRAKVSGIVLIGANLTHSKLRDVCWNGSDVWRANFAGSLELEPSVIQDLKTRGATFGDLLPVRAGWQWWVQVVTIPLAAASITAWAMIHKSPPAPTNQPVIDQTFNLEKQHPNFVIPTKPVVADP